MCTAVTYKTRDHYFGRTLDLECSYGEEVVITPREFPLTFRTAGKMEKHYAIIGMATVAEGYPLYYEAANEKGLAMAGLNFPGNAHYFPQKPGRENIAPFEFIPWILSQCKNVPEAREKLDKINLCDIHFSDALPLSPLHWLIADGKEAITVESVAEGLKIYNNPIGVLTNNPPFAYHMTHLCDYLNLTRKPPENCSGIPDLVPYSRGMGAIGLPGDLSSASRFVRAAFVKSNSVSGEGEEESVSQFFHILGAVAQQRGCAQMPDGRYEITRYTSCINLDQGIYYYTTYENPGISAVTFRGCDLEKKQLCRYPLRTKMDIHRQN